MYYNPACGRITMEYKDVTEMTISRLILFNY